mmetsp:Transcript_915/g.2452  ORF Transcript_915/g.2452 Transcript_915/m.2452 type:complete len:171 (-) Transcript_915:571-1083(-)|eukprot:CAMPEP_0202869218 /NCGR_PEP_ID=MMETSP1391-20130828/12175_1 /ASSEMBLY_ACC=CAM_ASM_000867 /TAXON_ID=1034604 /ORGANISM="Chlamydomonas leiostraca, Strain SAG 11-49" /LENGTH=170 /DNA_ID=CAMNT_0049549511 /DNA_START=63 /DNA_END=575 /DNA_ORIENTATION=+
MGQEKFAIFGGTGAETKAPPKTIHEAAEQGATRWVTNLIERTIEVDIDQRDNLQRTALHWAAEMGHIETAQALLDFGADVDAAECNGRTPVHLAARSADAKMLVALLEAQAPDVRERMVNKTDNFGITPLFLTLQKGEEGRPAFEVLMGYGGRYSELSAPKTAAHALGTA